MDGINKLTVVDMLRNREKFFGIWTEDDIDIGQLSKLNEWNIRYNNNWIFAEQASGFQNSLLNKIDDDSYQIICFRGYVVDAPIHSYSNDKDIYSYWKRGLNKRHNGVFSCVMVTADGKELQIVTDLFGICPLYYRLIGNAVALASDPSLLYQLGDPPDHLAWYMRLSIGYVPGIRSLINGIHRVPNGSVMIFKNGCDSPAVEPWYDLNNLSKPSKTVDHSTVKKFDCALEKSVKRLKSLNWGKTILPLSGGFDSRLIFGQLTKSKLLFDTYTVQISDIDGNDVDAVVADSISSDHGVSHYKIEMPNKLDYLNYDKQRIEYMEGMTAFHTWSVPLFDKISGLQSTIYDGLAGDILANGSKGWRCNGKEYSVEEKYQHVISRLLSNKYSKILNRRFLNNKKLVDDELKREYKCFRRGENQSELNYILWQSRKSTSLWAQQQAGSGQLLVYPYLDIDYIELALSFGASNKKQELGQARILKETFPELSKYGDTYYASGNSNYIGSKESKNCIYACQNLIKYCFSDNTAKYYLKSILSRKYYLLFYFSQHSEYLCRRTIWWSKQVAELVYYWSRLSEVINIKELIGSRRK